MDSFVGMLKNRFGVNNPILLDEVMEACPEVTPDAVYRRLRKAVAAGALAKKGRGVYYVPQATRFGPSTITDEAVLLKKYVGDEKVVYGYVSGLSLQNEVGVSDQVPGTLEIVTNKETMRRRSLGKVGGYKEVILRCPRVEVTAENVDALKALDLVTAVDIESLNDIERVNLSAALQKVGRRALARFARSYPAKTSKRLLESEAYGVLA